MGNLFGSKKHASRVTEQDKAVLQLKQQRDKLKQYQKKIAVQLEKDKDVAKQLLRADKKDKALLILRKKKYQESLLIKTDQQLDNIDRLVGDIEFAQVETEVVKGLEKGNKALKTLHQFLTLERVEQIMDETQESVEYQREIDSLLSGGLSQQEEDDVEAELDQLLGLEDLPSAPTDKLPSSERVADPSKTRAKKQQSDGRVAMEAS